MNFENAQTICGNLVLYSAINGASVVCAKNLKVKQIKRKQKSIKTEKENKNKIKRWLDSPGSAAHQLAQPTLPREQPTWPAPFHCSLAIAAVEHTEVLDGDEPRDGCHRDATGATSRSSTPSRLRWRPLGHFLPLLASSSTAQNPAATVIAMAVDSRGQ